MGDDDSWKSMSMSSLCKAMIAQLGEIMQTVKNIQAKEVEQERMKKQAELETTILKKNLALLVILEPEEFNLKELETLQQDPSLVVLQSNNIRMLESERSLNSRKATIAPFVVKSSFLMESNNRESEKWLLPYACLEIISWSLRTSSQWKRGIMIYDYGSKFFGSYHGTFAAGGAGDFTNYQTEANTPVSRFTVYSDGGTGRSQTFKTYTHGANAGHGQSFTSYSKKGNASPNEFASATRPT
ncbi:Uncharacterized protein Rs2_34399 [Raphanus sativus]|nr:Uncharacterized protein Rs2_34399 [Raphanus sativus]